MDVVSTLVDEVEVESKVFPSSISSEKSRHKGELECYMLFVKIILQTELINISGWEIPISVNMLRHLTSIIILMNFAIYIFIISV